MLNPSSGTRRVRPWQADVFAVVVTAATFGVRFALSGQLDRHPALIIFTVPIMASAYLGGLRSGLVATALVCLGSTYFLLPPFHSFATASAEERWLQVFVVLAGVFISVLSEALHRSRRRVEAHEVEIARVSRLHAALSQINQAIVWTKQRDELFPKICRVLVEHGGFHLAWIGWLDPATRSLAPVATWGHGDEVLRGLKVFVEGDSGAGGAVETAFAEGRPQVANDVLLDPSATPWHAQLARLGARAVAVFPIRENDRLVGAIVVHSDVPHFFQDKEVALLTEAATDVSFALDNFRRRAAEQQAAEEAFRLAAIVESSDDAIISKDLHGIVTTWNPGAEKLFGYPSSEMIGQSITRLLPPEREEEEAMILGRVIRGETVRLDETVRLRKDGRRIDIAVTVSPIRETTGKIVGASKVARDITQQKYAVDRLRRSEASLANAQRIARVGNWEYDIATGVVVWSAEIYRICGISQAEFGASYQAFMATVHPADRQRVDAAVRAVLAGEGQYDLEHRIVRPDGTERIVHELGVATRDTKGRPTRLAGTMQDVTERVQAAAKLREGEETRREAEEQLRQLNITLEQRVAERTAQLEGANRELAEHASAISNDLRVAEAADQLKSAFLATMSHELRTPLNSIIGFTGILLKGMAGAVNAEQTKQLGMVRGSARHLLELINDVLDLSKIEAGQLEVRAEPFDLRESIARVLASIRPQVEKKALTLTAQLPPELGAMISDRRRVEQILLNLVSNAIKFTERGSITVTIEVRAADALSPTAEPRASVRMSVADTGIGIAAGDLDLLFQPFRQIDSGLARQSEGTGLGLAICRRLATLLGGEICARSEPARGSEFTVTLPLHLQKTS